MKVRCNNVIDCSDRSDERVCEPLRIDNEEYRKTFPPFTGSNKTNIDIKIVIASIEDIDELLMTFTSEVKIFVRWRDQRIIFRNLAQSKKVLSNVWRDQIWLPPLYFSNTKENKQILNGNYVEVAIIPCGQPLLNKISELNEGNLFKGGENDLELYSVNELTFKCNFELWNYPFDVQDCSVNVKIPSELRNYTILNPKQFIYSGILTLDSGIDVGQEINIEPPHKKFHIMILIHF